MALQELGVWSHTLIDFPDKKQPVITFEEGREISQQKRKSLKEARIYQNEAVVSIETDQPIVVYAIGDVHYGSVYCDIQKFMRDIELIRQTPNAYIVFMGNLIDNGNPSQFPDSLLANVMTPDQQARSVNELIRELDAQGKILGAVKAPCHEGWTWKKMGIDINRILYENTSFPILNNGGVLHIKLNGTTYDMALYHQFGRFGSQFNHSHPAQQMQRMYQKGQADIIILAHSHYGEVVHTYIGQGEHRKPVVYIRSGSYKGNVSGETEGIADMWLEDQTGWDGEPGGEAVILWADKKQIYPVLLPDIARGILGSQLMLRSVETRIDRTTFEKLVSGKKATSRKSGIIYERRFAPILPPYQSSITIEGDALGSYKEIVQISEQDRLALVKEERRLCSEATAIVSSDSPIALFAISDIHFGSYYAHVKAFEDHVNLILDTKHAYVIFLGQLIDNINTKRTKKKDNSLDQEQQIEAINALLRALDERGKVLAAVRVLSATEPVSVDKNKKNLSLNDRIYEGTNFPVLENGGILTVRLQNANKSGPSYRILLYSVPGPFESQFNKSHPALQQLRVVACEDVDGVVMAGSHVAEALHTYYGIRHHRTPLAVLRSGCYMGNVSSDQMYPSLANRNKRGRTGGDGEPGGQALILYHDHKHMFPVLDPYMAKDIVDGFFIQQSFERMSKHKRSKVKKALKDQGIIFPPPN